MPSERKLYLAVLLGTSFFSKIRPPPKKQNQTTLHLGVGESPYTQGPLCRDVEILLQSRNAEALGFRFCVLVVAVHLGPWGLLGVPSLYVYT